MKSRIKAWVQLAAGGLGVSLGIISVVNYSFDWSFIMPPSLVLAGVLVLVGGIVFASGLLSLDSPPKSSTIEDGRQERGRSDR
jgi:hypothetical protein